MSYLCDCNQEDESLYGTSPNFASPALTQISYRDGSSQGVIIDAEGVPTVMRALARYQKEEAMAEVEDGCPHFEESRYATGSLVGSHKGKLVAGWQFGERVWSGLLKGRQLTGDCVSWGTRLSIDLNRSWKCVSRDVHARVAGNFPIKSAEIFANAEQIVNRQATALLYSGRGHNGEGANCSRISNWACKQPILLEQDYGTIGGKRWDFSDYNKYYRLGMQYGTSGLPRELVEHLREKHGNVGAKAWKLVQDPRAVLDLITQGYFPHVGSMMAWKNEGSPISVASGSWAHDMCCVGFDDTPEAVEKFGNTVVFVDQSWGDWNRVTGRLPSWEPWGEGMFAISFNDFARWVSGGECCVMTETVGFEVDDNLPWNSPWWPTSQS